MTVACVNNYQPPSQVLPDPELIERQVVVSSPRGAVGCEQAARTTEVTTKTA
jgi:hypothetical protein